MQGFPIVLILSTANILLTFMALSSKRLDLPRAPENKLIVGLFIAVLMSQIVNGYFTGLAESFDDFGKIVIFYFLTLIIVNSTKKMKMICWTIVLSATIFAINAILQYYRGVGLPSTEPLFVDGAKRVIGLGIFSDPNDLALLFVLSFPLVLAFVFEKRGFFSFMIGGAFGALITWGLWLTNSRSGLLGFIVAVLIFFRHRFRGAKWIAYSLLIVIPIVAFLPTRLTSVLDTSAYERLMFWGCGNIAFKSHPIFGVGHNMIWQYMSGRAAHSSYVQCYGELGFFGYFFWVALFYTVLLGLYRLNDNSNTRGLLNQGELPLLGEAISASLLGYLVVSIFLSRAYIVPLYLFFAFGVRIRYLAVQRDPSLASTFSKHHMWRVAFIAGGSIMVLYMVTRIFVGQF